MNQSPSTPESSASSREFKPAVDAAELLAQSETAPTPAPGPQTEQQRKSEGYRAEAVQHITRQRAELGLVDEDGKLDVQEKFRQSAYEILDLDYYRISAHDQQGIPMPEQYRTDEELREFYILETQQLIEQIVTDKPDMIMFLDKSARPVSQLVRELWPLFVDEADAKMPEHKFINIDANVVLGKGDTAQRPTTEEVLKFQPSTAEIEAIRHIYDRPMPAANHPENAQRILVVDEVQVTGATSQIADRLLHGAFPDLEIKHASWMSANVQPTGRRGYENMTSTQLPPWYNKHFIEGRGIDDPADPATFLGEPLKREDVLSQALRTDIQLLAKDIREGKQSVRPGEGCFMVDPKTGREDLSKPKYKIGKISPKGERQVIPQYQPEA